MTDYYEQLARLFVSLLVALSALLGSSSTEPTEPTEPAPTTTTTTTPPAPQYATPCQEDEAWYTVPYWTAGAIEDANGVSRLCVNLERIHYR